MKKLVSFCTLLVFLATNIIPSEGMAQSVTALGLMPAAGVRVGLTDTYTPAYLKGLVVDPQDPFKFEFMVYQGDLPLTDERKQAEYTQLIKYFLAAMAVPDKEQWVNLSPYEKDRIIPDSFGLTEMGRDLLAQDYLLKQLTSSLTDPDTDLGKKFWDGVYSRAHERFGTTDIPTSIFNKVWVTPDKASIFEKGQTVYVVTSRLKVMTDVDHLALEHNASEHGERRAQDAMDSGSSIFQELLREIILPELEREINEGRSFAPVRQVYSAMLLATWYKRALKRSVLAKIYADQGKVQGIDQDPQNNTQIYQKYVEAFKKGVVNMIREDVDRYSKEVIPRQYFSGGIAGWENILLDSLPLSEAQPDFYKNDMKIDNVVTWFKGLADAPQAGAGGWSGLYLQRELLVPESISGIMRDVMSDKWAKAYLKESVKNIVHVLFQPDPARGINEKRLLAGLVKILSGRTRILPLNVSQGTRSYNIAYELRIKIARILGGGLFDLVKGKGAPLLRPPEELRAFAEYVANWDNAMDSEESIDGVVNIDQIADVLITEDVDFLKAPVPLVSTDERGTSILMALFLDMLDFFIIRQQNALLKNEKAHEFQDFCNDFIDRNKGRTSGIPDDYNKSLGRSLVKMVSIVVDQARFSGAIDLEALVQSVRSNIYLKSRNSPLAREVRFSENAQRVDMRQWRIVKILSRWKKDFVSFLDIESTIKRIESGRLPYLPENKEEDLVGLWPVHPEYGSFTILDRLLRLDPLTRQQMKLRIHQMRRMVDLDPKGFLERLAHSKFGHPNDIYWLRDVEHKDIVAVTDILVAGFFIPERIFDHNRMDKPIDKKDLRGARQIDQFVEYILKFDRAQEVGRQRIEDFLGSVSPEDLRVVATLIEDLRERRIVGSSKARFELEFEVNVAYYDVKAFLGQEAFRAYLKAPARIPTRSYVLEDQQKNIMLSELLNDIYDPLQINPVFQGNIIPSKIEMFDDMIKSRTSDDAMKGGIDMAASALDMQLRHEGEAIILPLGNEEWEHIQLRGLVPVILEIKPAKPAVLFN